MAQTVSQTSPPAKHPADLNAYPFWSPRFWHGMLPVPWFRLVARNRFRIHPLRWPMAIAITLATFFNLSLHVLQQLIYSRRLARVELDHPPIFIIGHWRSGTTFLHELLVCDERFAFPTTYECFAPTHFLVSGWIVPRALWFLLPAKRAMDDMSVGFDRPQEDEFALCSLGAPSPYLRMAFPNHPPPYMEFLDMRGTGAENLRLWKQALRLFLKTLTYAKQKQLVLKSPPHTGRVAVLAEMFPGAKFIHIVRNPYAVFASTRRLWPSLDAAQGLQIARHEHLDAYIFDAFDRMYSGFEQQREMIAPEHICDVRYEDLVRDPVGELEAIYHKLQLGDFEPVRPHLAKYMQERRDYKTNRHALDAHIKAEIDRRWRGYFEKYGYEVEE